jgi:CHAT domain-containing protein
MRAQNTIPRFYRHEAKLGLIAVMQAWDASLPTLPHVREEINQIHAAAKQAGTPIYDPYSIGNATTVASVSEVFKNTNLVHIACHGTQNVTDALSSGFCLSDGNLGVSRLMDLDLKDAFLAFLSACETAKGDEKQPDQSIHLAATMLFVGFRSVVATMW